MRNVSILTAILFMCATSASSAQEPVLPATEWGTEKAPYVKDDDQVLVRYSSCGECGTANSGGVYAGAAAVFAKPFFTENTNYVVTLGVDDFVDAFPFDYDREITPRVWLGYQFDEKWGAQVTYWQYDQGGNPTVLPPTPTPGETREIIAPFSGPFDFDDFQDSHVIKARTEVLTTIGHGLELHALDLEATRRFGMGKGGFQVKGGLRYARLRQTYFVDNRTEGGNFFTTLDQDKDFEGVGPTISTDVTIPVASSGLNLFAGSRLAVLFGERTVHRQLTSSRSMQPTFSSYEGWEPMGVMEAMIGAEYKTALLETRSQVFARIAYEGQLWLEAGSPNKDNGSLGFDGISIAAGVDY